MTTITSHLHTNHNSKLDCDCVVHGAGLRLASRRLRPGHPAQSTQTDRSGRAIFPAADYAGRSVGTLLSWRMIRADGIAQAPGAPLHLLA